MHETNVPVAKEFRQIVLWPVQLVPEQHGQQIHKYWDTLKTHAAETPWKETTDEFSSDVERLSESRYQEFVTFLPFAQRFLYGEGKQANAQNAFDDPPIHIFSRDDVKQVRVTLTDNCPAQTFEIARTDLYFFFDIDVAVLCMEVTGKDIQMPDVMEMFFRFGRSYPSYWSQHGRAGNCAQMVEWLDANGGVLSSSDYGDKARYLEFVKNNHVPYVASHWAFLMHPLIQHCSDQPGLIRYREIEYQRMPVMSYLAFDSTQQLSRGDMIRLGLLAPYWDSNTLPYSAQFLEDFEKKYCYDRYWDDEQKDTWNSTRFMCTEQSLVTVGNAHHAFFTDGKMGTLSQYKNQFFLLFLIAHFQKAALLMISDRLVQAISHLDIENEESVKEFRQTIRHTMEIFLRFTHRYWFQEVSDQAVARDLFHMMHEHIETKELFEKTRRRIMDMQEYLESEQIRRQADTVVRLTVVTILGLIGTMTSGLLGMNLIDITTATVGYKLSVFFAVFIPVGLLTLYTVIKSKRLSVFLDGLSNERLSQRSKLKMLLQVWSGQLSET